MMKKRFDVSQLYTFIGNVCGSGGNKKNKLLFLSVVKGEEGKGGKKEGRRETEMRRRQMLQRKHMEVGIKINISAMVIVITKGQHL